MFIIITSQQISASGYFKGIAPLQGQLAWHQLSHQRFDLKDLTNPCKHSSLH